MLRELRQPLFIKDKNVAERIVVCGDPGRVEVFSRLIRNPIKINMDRGYIGYTGEFNSMPVSIIQHGLGGPSAEAVIGDIGLFTPNPKVIIRVGSGEGVREEMRRGDLVLPTRALPEGGVIRSLGKVQGLVDTNADQELLQTISRIAKEYTRGKEFVVHDWNMKVFSSDTFYFGCLSPTGTDVVDMETATIFAVSNIFGIKSGSILIVNKNLVTESGYERAEALPSDIKEIAGLIALNAATKVTVSEEPNTKMDTQRYLMLEMGLGATRG